MGGQVYIARWVRAMKGTSGLDFGGGGKGVAGSMGAAFPLTLRGAPPRSC